MLRRMLLTLAVLVALVQSLALGLWIWASLMEMHAGRLP